MTAKELENLLRRLGMSQVRASGQNIMACCPNHEERRPSWGISITPPHLHGCFSCGFKGGLDKLLRHFGWSKEQIENVVGTITEQGALQFGTLPFGKLLVPVSEQELWPFTLEPSAVRFLKRRGIKFSTAQRAGLLYHGLHKRVLFPWYWKGKFFGMTGRAVDDNPAKIEAYCALPKTALVYIPFPKSFAKDGTAVMVEGELDALAVAQSGWRSVCAVGRGSFSREQWFNLESLPVNSLTLFLDDDGPGYRMQESIAEWVPCKLFVVSWSKVRRHFRTSEDGKLDPAMFNSQELKWIRQNCVVPLRRLALGSS